MADKRAVIPVEHIEAHIFLIRGEKVMLSTHLAELYDVTAPRFPHSILGIFELVKIPRGYRTSLHRVHRYSVSGEKLLLHQALTSAL